MGRAQIDMKIFKLRQPIIYSFFSAPSNRCRRRWWVMQCVEVFGSWWYPCFKVTSFRAVSGVCSIQNRSGTHCSYPSEKSFVKECGSFFLAVTVQACTSVERFRGVDPSVFYSEIRHPFLLILCKQSRPYQENRTICQNLGKKMTTLAQFGTTTENCLVTPYMHQGTLAIVIFHGLSSNFKFERLLLAIVLDLGSGSGI